MVPTEGDLRRRRDCHVWTEMAWTARETSLPLAKNWRWLRAGGEPGHGGQVHAYLAKGKGQIERFRLGRGGGGDLTRTGTMLLPSGPGQDFVGGLDLFIFFPVWHFNWYYLIFSAFLGNGMG